MDPDSYGRTVENLFHFSFLIKEGNASIDSTDGNTIAAPKDAPSSTSVESGSKKQYVLRFDFKSWEGMRRKRKLDKIYLPTETEDRLNNSKVNINHTTTKKKKKKKQFKWRGFVWIGR